MSFQLLLTTFKQLDPQGFEKMAQEIPTICSDLKLGQMMFIDANLAKLPEWLKTPEGKIAFQTFVQDWQASARKE